MGLHPDGDKLVSEDEADIVKWCSAGLYVGGADTVRPLSPCALWVLADILCHTSVDRVCDDYFFPHDDSSS
jgi:hypothetical protein